MEKGPKMAKITLFSYKTRSSFHPARFLFPVLHLISRFIGLGQKILHKMGC